jgi:iron complex outermembrane receptor protein
VGKRSGGGVDIIDIYDIDYDALPAYPVTEPFNYESQKQLGLYVQDQMRLWDRISIVLGARHDRVTNNAGQKDNATTFRAGVIGEVGAGFSPFFSYTESFEPLAGVDHDRNFLRPKTGRQFEAGVKWQPDLNTIVTVTAFHIKETGRAIYLPTEITQAGTLITRGVELEARRSLPGDFELLVSYGYNKLTNTDSKFFIFLPNHTASVWGTKTLRVGGEAKLRLGAGVVYTGNRRSVGSPAPDTVWTVKTPAYTVFDALAEITWNHWRFTVNATNLFDKRYYASCLDRGDCFVGAPRNVMATVGFRF